MSRRNPIPSRYGRPITNIDSCLQDRCYTPYVVVVYTLNERFPNISSPKPTERAIAPIFSPQHRPVERFKFCENYKESDKRPQPILQTFNNINDYLKEACLGHLYNKNVLNKNGAKGQNCTKVVKRVGYGQQFQYKLASLATYLCPHFPKLKKYGITIPKFIEEATILKKTTSKCINSGDLGERIVEIRNLSTIDKLPWLQKGDWLAVFKQIDKFLSDLTTYLMKIEKKSDNMRNFREEKDTMKLNKFSKDVAIYEIKKSNLSFSEHNNGYLLRQKLSSVDPWVLVRIDDSLLMDESRTQDKVQKYNARRKFWSLLLERKGKLYLEGIKGGTLQSMRVLDAKVISPLLGRSIYP